jgi:REP element-mobilizing transposase RayT
LKGHDYSSGGRYFITICTNGKVHWFGNISDHKLILSESGQIAEKMWYELPDHFPYISLDEFVVMPDHVHGIIIIGSKSDDYDNHDVETLHATSLPKQQSTVHVNPKNDFMASISPKPGSLGTIIRSYKSVVSKNVRMIIHDFSWQPRYYDHLIRSDSELKRIRKYIIENPIAGCK